MAISRTASPSATTVAHVTKAAGDISSVFPSLSGRAAPPLPDRFRELKLSLLSGKEDVLRRSWMRLLEDLQFQTKEIARTGSAIIPSIDFADVQSGTVPLDTIHEIRRRGCAVIRGVLPQSTALDLKAQAQQYIAANRPNVKAFPADAPAVYELYWSPSQVAARAHANMLTTQRFLQSLWHSSDPTTGLSTRTPLTYADRIRIRNPGDAKFALGPHVDGGSLERWEDLEYRAVYERILAGDWESYDPFDAAHRIDANMDLYNGPGACAMFRMFQGWTALSSTGPGEGTLKLFPLIKYSTAYTLLRPFFDASSPNTPDFSHDATFPNSVPGAAQEYSPATHPHLNLAQTMVSVPRVDPGDYVAWHCDAIHAVDAEHKGASDSSVLYIPATPLCRRNVEELVRQRDAAAALAPPPDFPGAGGTGEAGFQGRVEWEGVGVEGLRAMGMGPRGWDAEDGMTEGERAALRGANEVVFGEAMRDPNKGSWVHGNGNGNGHGK